MQEGGELLGISGGFRDKARAGMEKLLSAVLTVASCENEKKQCCELRQKDARWPQASRANDAISGGEGGRTRVCGRPGERQKTWRRPRLVLVVFVAIDGGDTAWGKIFELAPAANQLSRMGRWGISAPLQQSKH